LDICNLHPAGFNDAFVQSRRECSAIGQETKSEGFPFGIGALTGDFAQLFEGGFEVFDDFLGENVGLGKVIGLFEALSRSHKTSTVRKKLLNPLLDVVLD
jgi:hypothetical protein